jgi:hypothetical protein
MDIVSPILNWLDAKFSSDGADDIVAAIREIRTASEAMCRTVLAFEPDTLIDVMHVAIAGVLRVAGSDYDAPPKKARVD